MERTELDHQSDTRGRQPSTPIVAGETLQSWPQDLYIPPDALEVILEAFSGPLDLLLYLIRKQDLDILDIPVAEITRQYMEYVEFMQQIQLDLASEYLVMAATLAEIKSRKTTGRIPVLRSFVGCRNTNVFDPLRPISILGHGWKETYILLMRESKTPSRTRWRQRST